LSGCNVSTITPRQEKEIMGKQWKDMDKVERRIIVVIATIVIAVLIYLFILPRILKRR
jgi:cell division protein FtsL